MEEVAGAQPHESTSAASETSEEAASLELAHERLEALRDYLRSLGSVAVAFSGGVDSTFLLKVAHDTLGDNAVAVTARSEAFPEREWRESQRFCTQENILQVSVVSEELAIPGFADNPENRCYLCKRELFSKILAQAADLGVTYVCEGSNMDDEGDYRPGLRAIEELGIKSPLRQVGFYKVDIRALSREMGLRTWCKQSFACLASRFAYGDHITKDKLGMVDRAEQVLLNMGFRQVRVRMHGEPGKGCVARIEVGPQEMEELFAKRQRVVRSLQIIGFAYVTMDLRGYRTGSMNKTLSRKTRAKGTS